MKHEKNVMKYHLASGKMKFSVVTEVFFFFFFKKKTCYISGVKRKYTFLIPSVFGLVVLFFYRGKRNPNKRSAECDYPRMLLN